MPTRIRVHSPERFQSNCARQIAFLILPCPHLSAGEIKFETATPRPGDTEGAGGPKQSICLLLFPVSPRLRGAKVLSFGCNSVALCLRGVLLFLNRRKLRRLSGLALQR